MNLTSFKVTFLIGLFANLLNIAVAEPVTYTIDPSHTYPSFETDHFAGLSTWRGKVNSTSGTIVMDITAQTGSLDVTMDMATIDFGHEGMNKSATGPILEVEKFPTANYVGTLKNFVDGKPTTVEGTLTLHGVTKPLNLVINRFRCQPHVRAPQEVCGADVSAVLDRSEYGLDADLELGFFPEVKLLISVEARGPRTE